MRPEWPPSLPGPLGAGPAARALLSGLAVLLIGLILVLPLLTIFAEALSEGLGRFADAIRDPDATAAIRLTLTVAAVAVPCNAAFGLAAAWCLTRFRFPGRRALVALVGLPFSVSPVISGLCYVLLFGTRGWFGPVLSPLGVTIIFALPGIVLSTIFVTLPFVAAPLIPLMESQGIEEEEAALTLGAGGWQTFRLVTLPRVRWGLLYGVLLCNARAMGEFGAVSVVSGHVRGLTNTMPLHIEILYNEYQIAAAFAVATLLAMLALLTIALRGVLEWREGRAESAGARARLLAA